MKTEAKNAQHPIPYLATEVVTLEAKENHISTERIVVFILIPNNSRIVF